MNCLDGELSMSEAWQNTEINDQPRGLFNQFLLMGIKHL